MKQAAWLCWFILVLCVNSFSFIDTDTKPAIAIDSSNIELRQFSDDAITSYQDDEAYLYDRPPPKDEERYIQNFILWLLRSMGFAADSIGSVINLADAIIYGLISALLLYAVFKVFGMSPLSVFRRSSTKKVSGITSLKEDIREIDFNQLVNDAVSSGDYRFAIRYYYLWLLKTMDNKNIIIWQPDKTNRDYLKEINSKNKPSFIHITRVFEYVWYGENDIDHQHYTRYEQQFETIFSNLDTSK